MRRRPFLKYWKRYVISKYNKITEHHGGICRGISLSSYLAIIKNKRPEDILLDFFRICEPSRHIVPFYVWNVYAIKQKRHHKNGSLKEERVYGEYCGACYVCGSSIGVFVDSDGGEITYPWNISTVVKDNECHDIINYRICCDTCHLESVNHDSLYDYAISQGYTKSTSLAVRDGITTLIDALKVYNHRYCC